MASDLASHAYDHCLAVLRESAGAADAATTALHRGGRLRLNVLAHARHQALLRAAQAVPLTDADDVDTGTEPDLRELAWRLAATRPPVERAIVDIDTRHGLERAARARVLGLSAERATAWTADIHTSWEAELGPALLAALGPGDCAGLAAVLEAEGVTGDRVPLERLRAAASAVAAHAEECAECADRRRAMVSVHDLLAAVPLVDAPEAVRGQARSWRLPSPMPPPIEPGRRRVPLASVAVVAAILLVVSGALLVRQLVSGGRSRVDALAHVPARNALVVDPSAIGPQGSVTLRNVAGHAVRWRARPSETWLDTRPDAGVLAPGQTATLAIVPGAAAPQGQVRATVQISADDGSATSVGVTGVIACPTAPTTGPGDSC